MSLVGKTGVKRMKRQYHRWMAVYYAALAKDCRNPQLRLQYCRKNLEHRAKLIHDTK